MQSNNIKLLNRETKLNEKKNQVAHSKVGGI